MTSDWGRFLVSSGGSTYDVKGSGSDLSSHVNHVVQIQGLPDTKAASGQTVPFYALKVQDAGQACGANGATATASAPATAAPATNSAPAQPPAMSEPAAPAAQPAATATPNTSAAPNMASAAPAPAVPAESAATQETNGGGTMAAPPQSAAQTFEGCVAGSTNNYQLKSNGKTYRLQGDTTSLNGLTGHTVAITGEDFNGKAIQVDGARDMGKGCKK